MSAPIQVVDAVYSLPANADLSASQFCAVDENSSGYAALPSAGGTIVGVLQNNPDTALKACEIQAFGIAPMKLGGTVTKGDTVKVDSSGRAVTASAGDIAAGAAIGRCMVGGAINNIGSVLLGAPGAGNALVTGLETVTSGALSAYTEVSLVSATGTVALTLPDGLYYGQRKWIECSVAASTPLGTLTITTPFTSESATHVFTAVGQGLELVWRSAGWHIVRKRRAGTQVVVIGTTVLTGYDMAAVYDLQTTGTVHSLTTKSLPSGSVQGEIVNLICTVAATCPVGDIDFVGASLVGAAVTHITAITATTDNATLLWSGAAWIPLLNTGLTIN